MRQAKKLHSQKGLSLIEVLVSLVIFALGMLGTAGLQIATLKSNKYAASSAVAISLAKEYGELMQSFPSAVVDINSGTSSFFIDTSSGFSTTLPSRCTGSAASCTTSQLAQASIEDWVERVKATMPGGRAEVCRTSESRDAAGNLQWGNCDNIGDLVVIKLGWLAKNDKGETLFDGADRPKVLLPLLGNLRDFAVGP